MLAILKANFQLSSTINSLIYLPQWLPAPLSTISTRNYLRFSHNFTYFHRIFRSELLREGKLFV